MDGNVVCSVCKTEPATQVCFCSYPLVPLCSSECLVKHRNIPQKFHFEAPMSTTLVVSRENFGNWQNSLFNLRRAQEKLQENASLLSTFEAEMEAAIAFLHQQIEDIREEYRTAMRNLQANVKEMIENAVAETSAQVFCSSPVFSNPLSGWIWQFADPGYRGEEWLFRTRLEVQQEKGKWVAIAVEPLYEGIPGFACTPWRQEQFTQTTPKVTFFRSTQTDKQSKLAENPDSRVIETLRSLQMSVTSSRNFVPNLKQRIERESFEVERALQAMKTEVVPNLLYQGPQLMQLPGSETKTGNKANLAVQKQTKQLLMRGMPLPQQGEVPDYRVEQWMPIDAEEVKAVPGTTSDIPVDLIQAEELPPRPVVQSRDLGEGKYTNCRVCGKAYTSKDEVYQCQLACRCRHCIIEARAREKVYFCKNCNEYFPKSTLKLIDDKFDRCHICGIAVKCTEMERLAPCNKVCRRCVLLFLEPNTRASKSTKAACPCNPEMTFAIDSQLYKVLAKMPISACCTRATMEDQDLSCGHRVCQTHEVNLKVCRSCQRPRFT